MLLISAIGLYAVFRLGLVLGSAKLGLLAAVCTAAYPCYFAQSSMVLADLPAAAFTIFGLSYYLEGKLRAGACFCVAVLFKETAILAPLGLLLADLILCWRAPHLAHRDRGVTVGKHVAWTLAPLTVLTAWYAYHWLKTGVVFGNAEFFHYNVLASASLSRFLVALPIRIWQAFGHLGMLFLTVAAAVSLLRRGTPVRQVLSEPRVIRLSILAGLHLVVFSFLGGALLTRYLLPIVPLIVLAALATVPRKGLVAIAASVCFLTNLNARLPYHYPAEENLAYRDFVLVHQAAAAYLERNHPASRIAATWPATSQLSMPVAGYVRRPLSVLALDHGPDDSPRALRYGEKRCDFVLTFNREYVPPDSALRAGRILDRLHLWQRAKISWSIGPAPAPAIEAVLASNAAIYREWKNGRFRVTLLRVPQTEHRSQK